MTHYVRPDHHPLPRGTRLDGLGHDGASLNRRPKQSTAPAGLWAPAPEVVAEKAVRAKTISQAGNLARQRPCGTEAAAKRHKRNGEPLCDVCVAGREARRHGRKRKGCGTAAGWQVHYRAGEQACVPCRTAYRDQQRAKRRRVAEKRTEERRVA